MNIRKLFIIVLLPFFCALSVQAQEEDARQMLNEAEEAYDIGRIEEAKKMLEGRVQGLASVYRLRGYRLLSLCCLALEQPQEARTYATLVLKENPYYSPTVEYPARFIDLIEEIKQGMVSTVTTASSQSESVTEAPSPVTIITAEMIEELGYNKSLNQILAAYVPGIMEIGSQTEMENLSMHGAYANGQELILIMENGHRLNNRFNSFGATNYSVSTEKIDHIEVLRGPASSLYGNVALTAVVNIITKNGRALDGVRARYGYGSYTTHRADLLMGTQYMDADISAWASIYNSKGQIRHFNDGEGYYSDLSPLIVSNSTYLGPDKIYVGSYRNTPSYDIGFTFKLKGFDLMLSRKLCKKLYQTAFYCGYDYSLYPYVNGIMPGHGTEATHAEIGYTRPLGKLSVNASLYGDWYATSDYSVDYDQRQYHWVHDDGEGNPVHGTDDYYGEFEFDCFKETTIGGYFKVGTDYHAGNMKGSLLVGSQYEHFSLYSRQFYMGKNFKEVEFGSFYYDDLIDNAKEDNLSFFLQDKHYFLPQLILNVGARYDIKHRKEKSITALSPRLALMYVPDGQFSLKLSYSEAFADLAYNYRYIFEGLDFRSDPQRLSAIQLTAMGRISPLHLNYEVNAFYNKYSNLLQWFSREFTDNEELTLNNGCLSNIGIEGSVGYSYNRLSANLMFYYCHDLSSEDYYYNKSEKTVAGVPHFTLNLHGAWKLLQQKNHELKVYGHASYIGKKLSYTAFEEEDFYVDAKLLFDLGVKYCYRQRLQFSFDCENILNTDNYLCGPNKEMRPVFQRGRSLMASIAYQF